MGEWTATAYVRTENVAALQAGISAVLAADGFSALPATDPIYAEKQMHEFREMLGGPDPIRGVALLPGRPGWTIVRTLPVALLCHPPAGQAQPRLVYLGHALGADTVYVEVQDGASLFVLECRPKLLAYHAYGSRAADEDDLIANVAVAASTAASPDVSVPNPQAMLEATLDLIRTKHKKSRLINELAGLNAIEGRAFDSACWVNEQLGGELHWPLDEWGTIEQRIVNQPKELSGRITYFRAEHWGGKGVRLEWH